MEEQERNHSGMPSETAGQSQKKETLKETKHLDLMLYCLGSQWPIEQNKMAGKRRELLRLLREIGSVRLQAAIQRTIDEYEGNFCPPLSFIRTRIPPKTEEEQRKHYCNLCQGNGWVESDFKDEFGNTQVKRCPNFVAGGYRVAGEQSITPEMRADREAHPENYYGWADVKAYMAIRKAKPELSIEQVWEAVDETRKLMREAAAAGKPLRVPKPLDVKQLSVKEAWAKWNRENPAPPPTIIAKRT